MEEDYGLEGSSRMDWSENDRLRQLMKILQFKKQEDYANAIGVKQGSLSDVFRKKNGVGVSDAIKYRLQNEFNVNIEWLEKGKGDVFKDADAVRESLAKYIIPKNERIMIQQPTEGYIPVYDVAFTLGFTPTFFDNHNPEILGYVNFPEMRGSTYVVQAKGDSMSPKINDRDFVGIRPVRNRKNIDFGNPYGIVTDEFAVFKTLDYMDDENKIMLTSENPKHKSYPIDKSEIIHMFAVIGILSVKSITY